MARDEAYREAEQKIKEASRSGAKELDLSLMGLTALPESLSQLTQLQWLSLLVNELTALPGWLGQLTQLQWLNLDSNRLTALPESLGQLTQLQWLNLSNNRLTALPESLGQLTQLDTLYLNNNRLTALPEWIGQLTQLEMLYISNNQLIALPESLDRLKQLQSLDLAYNQLTTLPGSLKQLKAMEWLFLHGNPRLELLPDILGPTWEEIAEGNQKAADPRAILAFYFAQRNQSAKPLHEVKLLLVGHGRVGKTSLSKALRDVPHDEREPETPGIERHPLPLKAGKATITAHVWDFGGQEFLHQTHQFFFSQRSIYVVVLSGRQGRPMQEAEYWLRLIRTYGAGSPVIIALNQIKAHPFTVDEYFLRESYPEVKAVVRTDCDPRWGLTELRKQLGQLAGEMPSVREKIDPAWARVRTHLEEMEESFVTFDHYRAICAEMGVAGAEQQETLATILDCLGIALNYRDDPRLRDTSVLKPRWLVDGIYTVLRWLHKHETNGALRLEDFPKALKSKRTYPPDMHAFLLALMEKFELCFPVESKEGVYLVPGLLDANQPRELTQFLNGKARRIQFRYEDVRPPGLLPRFIVRSHTLSEGQPRWLRGVVLARGQARALVRGDHEGRVTDIFVQGEQADDRVWLAEFILAEMRVLNDKLPVRTLVESEASPGAWTDLEVLREAAQRNEPTRTERTVDGGTVIVPVQETLREVESPEASAPKGTPLSLFICYAHANERVVKRLITGLKVLAHRGYVAHWRDIDLVPGEDWDENIKERLANAQVILFMVSRDFLASDYITQQERPLAMKLMEEKQAVVVPVILSPCSWQEEDFAKLENLPHKGRPISSFNPRDEAWTLVETGLKKAVEQARQLSKISDMSHRPMMKR
jgi:internalin A